jgi:flagellar basal body P-ring protein FlgI
MMPQHNSQRPQVSRRGLLAAGLTLLGGCSTPLMRGQTPEPEDLVKEEEKKTELVGDYAGSWGMTYTKLESVALITNLDNTGSDPPPSPQRNLLIAEMQTHEVSKPNEVLASPTTSMVMVRGFLPPGAQKGETFDVEVRVPPKSETTSLRNGWLMASRLRQMAVMGGGLHSGSVEALAQGDLLVDAVFEPGNEKMNEVRGRVLGGAVSMTNRKLGLGIRREDKSVRTSVAIGAAVSSRFHNFDHGIKKGVAKPTRDNFLELTVPPRYRNNLARYIRVVRSIAIRETPQARAERLALLERKLLNPPSSGRAAVELEAIGKDAIGGLKKGLTAPDPEVRFYAAEALAYLDDPEAAKLLGQAAAKQHAFRWHALTALTVMDHLSAYEALNVESVECRYGAFRAIWTRNSQDPLVRGEMLGNKFSYHVLGTTGEPLVHVARSRRQEIVLFGADIRLQPQSAVLVGSQFVIKSETDDQVKVVKLTAGADNQIEYCSMELDRVIRALVKLGAGYGEVIQALRQAKQDGALQARLAFEALASPHRQFDKEDGEDLEPQAPQEELTVRKSDSPEAELFRDQISRQTNKENTAQNEELLRPPVEETPKPQGFFGRMADWLHIAK